MITYPSLSKFTAFVELKDFRAPTKKEYVRYVRKLGEHYQCDPATLSEDQVRAYYLFLRQHQKFGGSAMKVARCALRAFFRECLRIQDWTVFEEVRIVPPQTLPLVLTREQVATHVSRLRATDAAARPAGPLAALSAGRRLRAEGRRDAAGKRTPATRAGRCHRGAGPAPGQASWAASAPRTNRRAHAGGRDFGGGRVDPPPAEEKVERRTGAAAGAGPKSKRQSAEAKTSGNFHGRVQQRIESTLASLG